MAQDYCIPQPGQEHSGLCSDPVFFMRVCEQETLLWDV